MNLLPKNLDHLVYTAPSLEQGMDEIESLLGVNPVRGGRHPKYGTHNAQLSLGESMYLEIIAPDPELPVPEKGRLLADSFAQEPKLTTWVLREEQIDQMRSRAVANGLPLGQVESGKREKPDGTFVSWKLTDPYSFILDGTIPFLIHWGNTPHPSRGIPVAGELIGLEMEHPKAEEVIRNLKLLNVTIPVTLAAQPRIIAKIRTKEGIVILS